MSDYIARGRLHGCGTDRLQEQLGLHFITSEKSLKGRWGKHYAKLT